MYDTKEERKQALKAGVTTAEIERQYINTNGFRIINENVLRDLGTR